MLDLQEAICDNQISMRDYLQNVTNRTDQGEIEISTTHKISG